MTGVDKLQEGSKIRVPKSGERRPKEWKKFMNPSRIFILRPIATSLLMAAILLAGAVAYKQLPVSALPEVDYPTIQVVTSIPAPARMSWRRRLPPPWNGSSARCRAQQMTSTSSGGSSVITLQFSLEPEHRRGGAGSAGRPSTRRRISCRRTFQRRQFTAK